MNKKVKVILGIVAVVALVWGTSAVQDNLGGGDGYVAQKCDVTTNTEVEVNPGNSQTVLSAYSRRAWASVGSNGTTTQNIWLSFDEGASAVVGQGFRINSTSSPDMMFGLNTDFPYTGEVTALAASATTTLNVIECRY